MQSSEHAQQVFACLSAVYPEAHCELNYATPFQLLIATILSAQSTDAQVNKLTQVLFTHYPTPETMVQLEQAELEEYIKGCGLYRNKAKYILAACRQLLDEHAGEVPRTRAELMALPGVGRKTANVVLANAFDLPAFAVDTHVLRVSRRLGLSDGSTPRQVEADMTALLPPAQWKDAHHQLIWHGRRVCWARNPQCAACPLMSSCPSSRVKEKDVDE